MKLVSILSIDDGWVDTPNVSPAYIFNNMKDLVDYFNKLGVVEVIKEPNPNNVYEFGAVVLIDSESNSRFYFDCIYAQNL